MRRRVFCAVMATETNTFSPVFVDRAAFEASLLAPPGQHPDTPTLCSAVMTSGRQRAAEWDWEWIEGTAAWADPGGLVAREVHEELRDDILGQLEAAGPLDGVVLGLHGAMVTRGCIDPEGDLLARVRAIVGPRVPVVATLDPHSHLTRRRLDAADALVAFLEFPHVDFVERAELALDIARGAIEGRTRPVMSTFDCRMIDVMPTTRDPMRGFVRRLRAIETADPDVLAISVIHGFMAGDVPEMGTRMLVVTDGAPAKGEAMARELGMELFAMRGRSMMPQIGEGEAVRRCLAAPRRAGPVVVADMWDNPGGGTAGDATVLLRAFLEAGAREVAFATIWDPIAVSLCFAAGEGAVIPLRFGAKSAPGTGTPIDATVRVTALVRGASQRFGASHVSLGDVAVVRFDGVNVILNTVRAQTFDVGLFALAGIDPASQRALVVKSTQHFHASFAPVAAEVLYCSAGRPYPNDPATTPYRHAPRNIWPHVADPHGVAARHAVPDGRDRVGTAAA